MEEIEDNAAQENTPLDNSTPEGTASENTSPNPAAAESANEESSAEPVPVQETVSPVSKELQKFNDKINQVRQECSKVIVGQKKAIDMILIGLFTNGHVLLEGVPGIAKTMIAKILSRTLSADFSRIQFTPDLMPTDVIGTNVFNLKSSEFTFKQGPIFSNIVLIDEINRAPAKTQAALFEVMEEQQVTVDGITNKMGAPFMVLATQNPIEQEGTYKLPEAQLDRFLFKIKMEYPSQDHEEEILRRFQLDFGAAVADDVKAVLKPKDIEDFKNVVEKIHIKDELVRYIAAIVINTRNNGDLFLGASPRASLALMKAAKAQAALSARDFVIPEDIQVVLTPILNHRMILSAEREMEGVEIEDVIQEIIKTVEVPR
ncbi:MAG: MoxR family ATPase [Reichenbachiella sp.]|uniref:AAA family ATPase n=1 Tax=Reichenbachiella sp. TaxID=2184521 RepID=UPI0032659425